MGDYLLKKELQAIDEAILKVRSELENSGMFQLLSHLDALERLRPPYRLPIAFIGQPKERRFIKAVQPVVGCRPTHLVLSEETANAYDIDCLQIANINTNIGDDPMPGDMFSVKFYQKTPELLEVMAFDIAWISPSNRILMYATMKDGIPDVPFRGIVWCGVQRSFNDKP